MIVRLLPMQIPIFWDHIKHALKKVEKLGTDNERGVYSHVFAKLMADKMQGFVIGTETTVDGIIITEILENDITHDLSLVVRVLYAFEDVDNQTWRKAIGLVKKVAKHEGCYRVLMYFSNPKIVQMGIDYGFQEVSKVLECSIGD